MILLSAGHNPEAQGATWKGWSEYQEACLWVREIMTHTTGVEFVPTGSLKNKVEYVNSKKATLAIEIHFNSVKIWHDLNKDGRIQDGEVQNIGRGSLTLFNPGCNKGKEYGTLFQSVLENVFVRHWDGVMEGWYRMDNRNEPDYFLSKTNCPALILEPEFIHHKELLQEKRGVACQSIAQVIRTFQ